MDKISKSYNSLIEDYKKIEKDINEQSIHDKRVILRRIFPILAAFNMKPSKVKNGEKAFKLFGQLHDIQVQKLKLENVAPNADITKYLDFLREKELKLGKDVLQFIQKKKIEFPSIKKKSQLLEYKVFKKVNKGFDKLENKIQARNINKSYDIHKIRIEFKKFRYLVEIFFVMEDTDEVKLEKLKNYQDLLGEIQDYDILKDGISRYYKKHKLKSGEIIEIIEKNKKTLIEKFDKELDTLIQICHDVISLNNDAENLDAEKIKANELSSNSDETGLMEVITALKQQPKKLLDEITDTRKKANILVIEDIKSVHVPSSPAKKQTVRKTEKVISVAKQETVAQTPKRATKATIAKTKESTSPTEKVAVKRKPRVAPKTLVKKENLGKKKDDTAVE